MERYVTRVATLAALFLLAFGVSVTPHAFAASSAALAAPTFSGLHTTGNRLANAQGQIVQLQGVNISQLDYSCAPSYNALAASSYPALKAWHINAVVIPANVYYWTGAKAGCDVAAYQARVYTAVDTALAQGMYPILSAYESGYDVSDMMPDWHTEQTVDAWATHYASDPRVLIQVFNEAHSGNGYTVTPAIWRDGDASHGYIGMERLIQDVNARAPHTVVLANSNDWGGVIGQDVSAGYGLTGSNIAYAVHLYDNGGNKDAANWPANFATLAQTSPVIATEYGTNIGASDCDAGFLNQIQPFMAAHLAGWFAWQWNPDSANYCTRANLIQPDNSSALATGTPSQFGKIVQAFYLGDGVGGPAGPPPPPPPTKACVYTVVPGDWLSKIGARLGVAWQSIAAWSDLSNPNLIMPGEVLVVCAPGGTPPPPPPPPSPPAKTCSYTVVSGDWLSKIAARVGVSWQQLAALNHLADPNLIYPGEVLADCLGQGAALGDVTAQGAAGASSYVVVAGDTLSGIGSRYGVAWTLLAWLNALPNPNLIYPGQHIALARGATQAAPAPTSHVVNLGAYGQCVWYVQSQRMDIQLHGDAWALAINAQRAGYRTGFAPAIGAIAVFQPYVDGASGWGHTGIVVAISGSWIELREMNVIGMQAVGGGPSGWDRVDYRWVPDVAGVAFIYGA